ncbi:TonB-dependent receptor [Psychrobium sp. MM17-31]|uniref:TonB-dependent receptor n=1 Tax=Psychrobium sp. MM17-31 TaxID=2917758 RepID=UPI001EF5BE4D|nr:TonB-dependent receptor [Psychrobium sp. MM17-31]MCG7532325.1 TonB-dependent receptor [Psychrobium sp. MM17-31]
MRKTKGFPLSLVCCAVLAAGNTAYAEEKEKSAEKKDNIEVIMVSAQKRVQRIIDVPTSIVAVKGEDIEKTGAQQLADIEQIVPNMEVEEFNSFNNAVYIRGVGAHSRQISFDTRVGVYLDGVYLGQSPGLNQELMDVESIEVLRGPQGSLFGKNTVAGAVNIITKKPHDEFEGAVKVRLGNYSDRNLSGFFNVPLSDDVFFKATASTTTRDGFVDNVNPAAKGTLGNRDVQNIRAQLQVESFENLELLFTVDVLTADENPLFGEHITDFAGLRTVEEEGKPIRQTNNNTLNKEARDASGVSMQALYNLDNGGSFKSITAKRNTEMDVLWDLDYSSLSMMDINYRDEYDQFTQEFQYTSPSDDKLEYIVGLYYYNQDSSTDRKVISLDDSRYVMDQTFLAGLLAANNLTPQPNGALTGTAFEFLYPGLITHKGTVETTSYAIFGNLTYRFAEDWQLGVGLRYGEEKRSVDWSVDGSNSGAFRIATHHLVDELTDDDLLPSLSLNYDVDSNTVAYARYAEGSKSGGYNLDFVNQLQLQALTFEPEKSKNIEVGIKGFSSDSNFRYSVTLFKTTYDNYQQSQFIDVSDGDSSATVIAISNAAEASTQGLEAEFSGDITDNLTYSASIGILDATFDYFPNGGAAAAPDVTGNRLPQAAEKQAAFALDYIADFNDGDGQWFAHVDVSYTGDAYTTNNNVKEQALASGETVPFGYIPDRTSVNARIGVEFEKWSASLWMRNALDSDDVVFSRREFFNGINEGWNAPRTFGIEATYKFQ